MSIILDILKELNKTNIKYKGIRVNLFGLPVLSNYKHSSVKATAFRMKNKGFLDKNNLGWLITKKGSDLLKNKPKAFKKFTSQFSDKAPKNLLIIFDVPQTRREYRDWFRRQLRIFGYILIQKSVWVGPSPLPKEFTTYIKEIGMKDYIKTFKLKKGYDLK